MANALGIPLCDLRWSLALFYLLYIFGFLHISYGFLFILFGFQYISHSFEDIQSKYTKTKKED